MKLSATEKSLVRTWTSCNLLVWNEVADQGWWHCFKSHSYRRPEPELAEGYLTIPCEMEERIELRKSIGAYQYGIVMWDKERVTNSKLKDIHPKDMKSLDFRSEKDSLTASDAAQHNKAVLDRFLGGNPQRPEPQPISRAVSPDTMSWFSDELRAMKKAKAMMSKSSLGAHRPQPRKDYPLGPVSSRRPDSRVSRRKKRH
ncbi:hypothetical protein ASPBRDRAFT_415946 [Aspergillus brasiliensis CBS 101740]|uniref:Uncharacterized protein n=1 Tax=Aspergillus brasiliensis (strain CBS 101740 / IMI 381727 / IBT 21946) TaxID=767769 RepID=A0A1L9UYB6_ASPBC|nr:hypothetical protein ASPBRDRAFT_415946 [Aspergillus brasiliensis CBS 101740]